MLVSLIDIPKTAQDWSVFAWAHVDQHRQIIQAIKAKFGISLTEYQLYPIVLDSFEGFLNWNQRSHDDFNGVLMTQGSDLTHVNISDFNQLEAFFYLHRREHETAANILHLG